MMERGVGYVVCPRDHNGPAPPHDHAPLMDVLLGRLRACLSGPFAMALSRQLHGRMSAPARRSR